MEVLRMVAAIIILSIICLISVCVNIFMCIVIATESVKLKNEKQKSKITKEEYNQTEIEEKKAKKVVVLGFRAPTKT